MKIFILTLLVSLSSFAQIDKALLQISEGPSVACEDCESDPNCPQNIVKDVLNGELTFMGRDLLPGSDQNRSCVFRGPTAYVIYNNCMGNKREAPATSIEVIPFTGGTIKFYVENSSQNGGAISTMPRSQYDGVWRVSLQNSPAPGNLNMEGVKTYLAERIRTMSGGGCYVGGMNPSDMSVRGSCYGGAQNPQWLSNAESFWRDPGTNWNSTLQRVRTKVISSY